MPGRNLITIAALLLCTISLEAQGWIAPRPGSPATIVRLSSDVHVTIDGNVASVEVEEWFENRGGALGEGEYMYPLPGEAVFRSYSLYQGDTELTGETMDADRARSIYEEIVRQRRDPALIELIGSGMLRARVFPINPGDRRRITMRYEVVLGASGDALEYRFVASRPAGSESAPDAAPINVRIDVREGDRFGEPFSPTHRLSFDRVGERMTITPGASLNRSFTVLLPFADKRVGLGVTGYRPTRSEDGYFLLTVTPGATDGDPLPRDITAVVDVSGSMSGGKLQQAQEALRQLLGSLNSGDRFRLIAFSNGVRSFRDSWTTGSSDDLASAYQWIDALRAEGGTNIDLALREALSAESRTGRLPLVVFMTDGLPSVGEQDPDRIAANAAALIGRSRVFAFGVGYDVNTLLLDGLTRETRGRTEYVEPGQSVETAIGSLATRLSSPVLTDLRLNGPRNFDFGDVYPAQLPDIFAGEQLVVLGRYSGAGRGTVTVSGMQGDRRVSYEATIELPEINSERSYIARLWASRKLGEIIRSIRLDGRSPALVEQARSLALRHGLLSEFTSYLVLEPEAIAASPVADQMAAPEAAMRRAAVMSGAGSGAQAVALSNEARARREASTLEQFADEAVTSQSGSSEVMTLAGRSFVADGERWIDGLHRPSQSTVSIKLYSSAYFSILEVLPELKNWVTRLERVTIAGDNVSLAFDDAGIEAIPDRELESLAIRFRGR